MLLALALLPLQGCGTFFKGRSLEPASPIGGFGAPAGTSARPGKVQPADVITLDLPRLIRVYTPGASASEPASGPALDLEATIAAFDQQSGAPDRRAEYRNVIIGAILMASEKNCEVYVEYLHGNQVAVRAISGLLATVFSGAAAVTNPVSSARVLAALGGASSGVGATLDQAAFAKLAAETIVAGIKANQAEGVNDLRKRMAQPYGAWPLTLAIRDALEVHDRCDAISALSYLQGAAQQTARAAATASGAGTASNAP